MGLNILDKGMETFKVYKNKILGWGRAWSLWSVHLCTGCCSPELMAVSCSRFDAERFGTLPFPAARQCDLLFILGVVSNKMAKRVRLVYDQMPDPKYVIALGDCAISGGLWWDSYCVVQGVDKIVPVDVYVPGCPPRPEAFIQGIMMLQKKIQSNQSKG
ncbi:MAG: NADH-quinone oxidoreductase subunit NuoB [Candidatus Bathyarchaeia archaeon]